ncbi:hypothetical protein WMY93_006244 [Mugilogobius chulae]|uniref:lysozyme n=1 Tax=Mugilogobius chulae TaxID=88201 RepID=A0AAW0PME7_9GOBI
MVMKMKMQGLGLLVLLCAVAQGYVYERCDWARFVRDQGMDGVGGVSLAGCEYQTRTKTGTKAGPDYRTKLNKRETRVCLIQHASNFSTSAFRTRRDGSTDNGIFMFNSRHWCNDGHTPTTNNCGNSCSAFQNVDLTSDVECAKSVVTRFPKGVSNWKEWRCYCEGKDLTKYTDGCTL